MYVLNLGVKGLSEWAVKSAEHLGSWRPFTCNHCCYCCCLPDAGSEFGDNDGSDNEVDDEETIDIEEAEESQVLYLCC